MKEIKAIIQPFVLSKAVAALKEVEGLPIFGSPSYRACYPTLHQYPSMKFPQVQMRTSRSNQTWK